MRMILLGLYIRCWALITMVRFVRCRFCSSCSTLCDTVHWLDLFLYKGPRRRDVTRRSRERSEASTFGDDQAVPVIPESGNVAFFHLLWTESSELKKSSVVDAEANLIVAKKNCGNMEIGQKELTVVCRSRGWGRVMIDYYIRMPFQLGLLLAHGTGGVTIFMIVPACTFLFLFALPLRLLLFWY